MSARTETLSDEATELLATMMRADADTDALRHMAAALDALLDAEDPEDRQRPENEQHAHNVYRVAYEGRTDGLAEAREVTVPEWAEGRSIEVLFRVARVERERDDLALASVRRMVRVRRARKGE